MKVEWLPTALVAGLCVLFGVSYATTYYVHPDSVLNSIQTAIDGCVHGDTILVGPGTYLENINFKGMAIVVVSEYGPDTTIIDGSSPAHLDTGSVVLFTSGEGNGSVLDGFTLTGGTGTMSPWGRLGGGISCRTASSPTIINNVVINNSSANYGGGIDCDEQCNALISNNEVTMNSAGEAGGGIEFYIASPIITYNYIHDNDADFGGGISCGSCGGSIMHNQITDNKADVRGGGIWFGENVTTLVESCIVAYNDLHGICCDWVANPPINYNNILENVGYGVYNSVEINTINAEYNWWGDASGPGGYGPGSGEEVSEWVDYDPWLDQPFGVVEDAVTEVRSTNFGATIFSGPLLLPEGKMCKVFDITGRVVKPDRIRPGIYFIEVDGRITRKVIKIK